MQRSEKSNSKRRRKNVTAWQQEKKNWSRATEEDGTPYFWNTKTDETTYEELLQHLCSANKP